MACFLGGYSYVIDWKQMLQQVFVASFSSQRRCYKVFRDVIFYLIYYSCEESPTRRQRSSYLSFKTRERQGERGAAGLSNVSYLNLKSEKRICFIAQCRKRSRFHNVPSYLPSRSQTHRWNRHHVGVQRSRKRCKSPNIFCTSRISKIDTTITAVLLYDSLRRTRKEVVSHNLYMHWLHIIYTDSRYVTRTSFPSRYASKNFLDQNSISEPLTYVCKYYIYLAAETRYRKVARLYYYTCHRVALVARTRFREVDIIENPVTCRVSIWSFLGIGLQYRNKLQIMLVTDSFDDVVSLQK